MRSIVHPADLLGPPWGPSPRWVIVSAPPAQCASAAIVRHRGTDRTCWWMPHRGKAAGKQRWRHPRIREAELRFLMNLRQSWLAAEAEAPNDIDQSILVTSPTRFRTGLNGCIASSCAMEKHDEGIEISNALHLTSSCSVVVDAASRPSASRLQHDGFACGRRLCFCSPSAFWGPVQSPPDLPRERRPL